MLADVYSDPSQYGLEILHVIEQDLSYEFDMLVVWSRVSDGALFYAQDAGCSCPTPFENYTGIEDLTPLNTETYSDFQLEAEAYGGNSDDPYRRSFVEKLVIDTVLHDVQRRLAIFAGVNG